MSDVHHPILGKVPWISRLADIPIIGPLIWLLALALTALIPTKYAELPKQQTAPPESLLFPSMSKATRFDLKGRLTPQPCSTGLTTRLLPFKNNNGEIEWAFTDDLVPGSELDAFKSPDAMGLLFDKDSSILSPVTSNLSNNSLLLKKESLLPQMSTPLSTLSDDGKVKDKRAYHQCPHCDSTFKMRGYLTRHLKKHAAEKAYRCPFHKLSVYKDEKDVTHRCHPSGGFSRRDTYKTHLKARHFRYPEGTPIKDRGSSTGHCSMCGEWFENAEIWCEIHIEGGECKYLPSDFKGKSRIKNRLKKQISRMMKEQRQKLKSLENLLPLNTPASFYTPIPVYDYNNSPTSVSSSIGPCQSTHDVYKTPTPVPVPDIREDYDDDFCLDTDQLGATTPLLFAQTPHVYQVPQFMS